MNNSPGELKSNQEIKQQSIIVIVLLSIVSLGVYLPYWFLVKRRWFNKIAKKDEISLVAPIVLAVLYGSLIVSLIPANLFLTGLPFAFFQYIELVLTYIGLALTLYLAFQVRVILNKYLEDKEISIILTLLFHIWYLQYKINQHFGHEKTS